MSENKTRTIDEIHREYTGLAAKAGHLEYGIVTSKSDLAIVYKQMRDLNFEAAALAAAAPKSEAASEAPKEV